MKKFLVTSESVTEGHPDKLCDQISDAIVDAVLEQDPSGHIACEVAITTGVVYVFGEITSTANIDIPKIARNVIADAGYAKNNSFGFDSSACAIITSLHQQSQDIALGVNNSLECKFGSKDTLDKIGAGDQGIMFGYASDETSELMPLPISLAHQLTKRLAYVRKSGIIDYLGPDGKSQVTVEYVDNHPQRITSLVISAQHKENIEYKRLVNDIMHNVINPVIPNYLLDENTAIHINPTGKFVIGGPVGDSGLTGRKIIVDTYGGTAKHGGGAFSGKDPTKVDRSGAYAARYIAKNIVAAKIASRCEVQLAYAIGVAHPVSIAVDTFGTGKYPDDRIVEAVQKTFDLRPSSIIKHFQLNRPIFRQFASYGHMGREDLKDALWENTDCVEKLTDRLKNEYR